MKKKILIAQFHHETNSFCPAPANETAYKNYRYDKGEETFSQRGLGTEIGAFLNVFEKRDDVELIPAFALNAAPSGPVTSEVYDFTEKELVRLIKKHSPLSGVLLTLHGAMVAENHPDGEGDLLECIRNLVGNEVPVIVSLDLHANVTEKMAKNATVLIPYEEYPHTDTYETGLLTAKVMEETLFGTCIPQMAYRHIPFLLPLFPSERPEIRPLYEKAKELEKQEGVISARFAHGFFMSDIDEMGMSVMVIADGNKSLAESVADELAALIEGALHSLRRNYPSLPEAFARAEAAENTPVVIADASDNPGAGAPGDSTHILRFLLAHKIRGAALATIVDPESVTACCAAGVGNTVSLSLGGKGDPEKSGGPLAVTAYVKMLSDGKYAATSRISLGEIIKHGKTAVVEIEGNFVIITSIPRQPWDIEVFRSHGITPENQKILITKSAVHFQASYGEVAKEMIPVALPGYAVPVPEGFVFKSKIYGK